MAKNYFKNINIDLIYGIENQTLEDFKQDIDQFLKLDIPHLSAYNIIIEPNTKLYIDNAKSNDDFTFDKLIEQKLKNYNHYEISNYAKKAYESKHNLIYWNNEHYYGFGLGASGYLNNIRYDNTKSLNKYLEGKYRLRENILDKNETIQNAFILGFRKIKGINKQDFNKRYKQDIKSFKIVQDLLKQKQLLEDETNIFINPKYIYLSNEILVKFIEKLY